MPAIGTSVLDIFALAYTTRQKEARKTDNSHEPVKDVGEESRCGVGLSHHIGVALRACGPLGIRTERLRVVIDDDRSSNLTASAVHLRRSRIETRRRWSRGLRMSSEALFMAGRVIVVMVGGSVGWRWS